MIKVLVTSFFIYAFLLLPASTSYAIRENKIIRVGYVDYAKLLQKVDKDGEIQEQVDNLRNSYKEKIDNLTSTVKDLQDKISSNPDAGSIQDMVRDLEQKSLDLSLLKIHATQDIENVTNTALKKVNEKIEPAIQNIAKKQHFDVIIDSSLILLANPSLDITNFVLASL